MATTAPDPLGEVDHVATVTEMLLTLHLDDRETIYRQALEFDNERAARVITAAITQLYHANKAAGELLDVPIGAILDKLTQMVMEMRAEREGREGDA